MFRFRRRDSCKGRTSIWGAETFSADFIFLLNKVFREQMTVHFTAMLWNVPAAYAVFGPIQVQVVKDYLRDWGRDCGL
jgi:hypothetical protein